MKLSKPQQRRLKDIQSYIKTEIGRDNYIDSEYIECSNIQYISVGKNKIILTGKPFAQSQIIREEIHQTIITKLWNELRRDDEDFKSFIQKIKDFERK